MPQPATPPPECGRLSCTCTRVCRAVAEAATAVAEVAGAPVSPAAQPRLLRRRRRHGRKRLALGCLACSIGASPCLWRRRRMVPGAKPTLAELDASATRARKEFSSLTPRPSGTCRPLAAASRAPSFILKRIFPADAAPASLAGYPRRHEDASVACRDGGARARHLRPRALVSASRPAASSGHRWRGACRCAAAPLVALSRGDQGVAVQEAPVQQEARPAGRGAAGRARRQRRPARRAGRGVVGRQVHPALLPRVRTRAAGCRCGQPISRVRTVCCTSELSSFGAGRLRSPFKGQ